MNMISTATAPYLLYSEKSGKPKQTYGNRFSDALEQEQAENEITVSAAEIAVNEMNRERTESTEPTYTVTEEEAAYFREKYGEEYNANEPFGIFNELAEKNIVSTEDANAASRKNRACTVEGFPSTAVIDKLLAANGGHYTFCNLKFNFSQSDYPDCGGSTYDSYRGSKNAPITTWEDYVEDNYNYYRYLMENYTVLRYFSGEPYVTDVEGVFASRCESAERVQNVLTQIFGEVSV
ncbi:MAG: hypothetical protein NC253_12925 [Ruminococcus sp.]|nr:hypothetical protein [Ruminococcus sp.]MCM1381666.1 hypothetical protein [Muribaculaceae bacterium]MCM1479897.1 hypothetical protein [Muribaculaceae bacterium]